MQYSPDDSIFLLGGLFDRTMSLFKTTNPTSEMALEQYGIAASEEKKFLGRLVAAYRKHLDRRDTNTQTLPGRRGSAVRRVEDGVFDGLVDLGVSKNRDARGDRPVDSAYAALCGEALQIVFVNGDAANPPKIESCW